MIRRALILTALLMATAIPARAADAQLPPEDGEIMVEAQAHPFHKGVRTVVGKVHYAAGVLKSAKKSTGMIVTLHNWGGVGAEGTADPVALANEYDAIAVTVNYWQSGAEAFGPFPYDHGLYQANDVLRVMHAVSSDLKRRRIKWNPKRIHCVGGSGGGNVCLNVAKFAPNTIRSTLALSAPMVPKFSPPLDSRWGSLPAHEMEIRDLRRAPYVPGVTIVHGSADEIAPYSDAVDAARSMGARFIGVFPHLLWGPFTDAGHSLGDRTAIARLYGEFWAQRASEKTDFDLKSQVSIPVTGGAWVMDYRTVPTLKWVGR